MPPTTETANRLFLQGASELAHEIRLATGKFVHGVDVAEAFYTPLKIRKDVKETIIYDHARPVLAIVDYDFPEARMMKYWIPELSLTVFWYEKTSLKAFGISKIEDFRYLEEIPGASRREKVPPTKMTLYRIEEVLFFRGYDRKEKDSFEDLRSTLWTIAMLPREVIEKAIKAKHCVLVSGNRGGIVSGESITIASITKGRHIENLNTSSARKAYKEGTLERDTPVIVFQYP